MSIIQLDRSDQLIFQQSNFKDLMATDYRHFEITFSNPPAEDVFRKEALPHPTAKIVADAFPSTKIIVYSDTDDAVSLTRTKGDIMGYSNDDNGDGDGDDGDDDDDRELDEEEKIVVPDTNGGLNDNFNIFLLNLRERNSTSMDMSSLLLYEMLDRRLVTPTEYINFE